MKSMNLPNRLTLLRIVMVPIFIVLCYLPSPWSTWVAMAVFALASATDLVDGMIARRMHLVTTFGKFMDPIADKLLVNSAMIMLVGQGRLAAWACCVFIGRELIISGFRLVAASKGEVMAAGWLGKFKTVFQMVYIILALIHDYPFSLVNFPASEICMWISMVLAVWSAVAYMKPNWHLLMKED